MTLRTLILGDDLEKGLTVTTDDSESAWALFDAAWLQTRDGVTAQHEGREE